MSRLVEHDTAATGLLKFWNAIAYLTNIYEDIVDGIWIRKWKVYGVEVKSRMCSRGCFDKQKHTIDMHSSTATRFSQRLVISTGMNGTMSGYNGHEYFDAPDDVDMESLDIQGAFLQGRDYQQLQVQARSLGYEVKKPRQVYVAPLKTFGGTFVVWHRLPVLGR